MLSMRSPSEVKLSMMRQSASITWHPRRRSLLEPVSARFLSAAVAYRKKQCLLGTSNSTTHSKKFQHSAGTSKTTRKKAFLSFRLDVFVRGFSSKNEDLFNLLWIYHVYMNMHSHSILLDLPGLEYFPAELRVHYLLWSEKFDWHWLWKSYKYLCNY